LVPHSLSFLLRALPLLPAAPAVPTSCTASSEGTWCPCPGNGLPHLPLFLAASLSARSHSSPVLIAQPSPSDARAFQPLTHPHARPRARPHTTHTHTQRHSPCLAGRLPNHHLPFPMPSPLPSRSCSTRTSCVAGIGPPDASLPENESQPGFLAWAGPTQPACLSVWKCRLLPADTV
jgi:hypothetical protein